MQPHSTDDGNNAELSAVPAGRGKGYICIYIDPGYTLWFQPKGIRYTKKKKKAACKKVSMYPADLNKGKGGKNGRDCRHPSTAAGNHSRAPKAT